MLAEHLAVQAMELKAEEGFLSSTAQVDNNDTSLLVYITRNAIHGEAHQRIARYRSDAITPCSEPQRA